MRVPTEQDGRADILGVGFDLIDYGRALSTIEGWRRAGQRQYVTFTNPQGIMLSRRDGDLARALEAAGLTLPDGVGIILAARMLGLQHRGRVTGPSFMLRLCDWGRRYGYRHYFYGGKEGVANELARRLYERYPDLEVAGTYCPPFRPLTQAEDDAVVEEINSTDPDILWVGLGAPKQEKWMAAHVGRIEATAMIGVGAAFDFHSGNIKWAPTWLRKAGMEWAHRLVQEPGRLWRRNIESPLFVLTVLKQRLVRFRNRTRQVDADRGQQEGTVASEHGQEVSENPEKTTRS